MKINLHNREKNNLKALSKSVLHAYAESIGVDISTIKNKKNKIIKEILKCENQDPLHKNKKLQSRNGGADRNVYYEKRGERAHIIECRFLDDFSFMGCEVCLSQQDDKAFHSLKKCESCSIVYYCSIECQKYGWKYLGHKQECEGFSEKQVNEGSEREEIEKLKRSIKRHFSQTINRSMDEAAREDQLNDETKVETAEVERQTRKAITQIKRTLKKLKRLQELVPPRINKYLVDSFNFKVHMSSVNHRMLDMKSNAFYRTATLNHILAQEYFYFDKFEKALFYNSQSLESWGKMLKSNVYIFKDTHGSGEFTFDDYKEAFENLSDQSNDQTVKLNSYVVNIKVERISPDEINKIACLEQYESVDHLMILRMRLKIIFANWKDETPISEELCDTFLQVYKKTEVRYNMLKEKDNYHVEKTLEVFGVYLFIINGFDGVLKLKHFLDQLKEKQITSFPVIWDDIEEIVGEKVLIIKAFKDMGAVIPKIINFLATHELISLSQDHSDNSFVGKATDMMGNAEARKKKPEIKVLEIQSY